MPNEDEILARIESLEKKVETLFEAQETMNKIMRVMGKRLTLQEDHLKALVRALAEDAN
jgi:hypothetical protein